VQNLYGELKMSKEYKTKDLAEAAALIATGQQLQRIVREGSICFFIFTDKIYCEKVSNEFFFGNLQVNARDYHESMNRLKNRIFR